MVSDLRRGSCGERVSYPHRSSGDTLPDSHNKPPKRSTLTHVEYTLCIYITHAQTMRNFAPIAHTNTPRMMIVYGFSERKQAVHVLNFTASKEMRRSLLSWAPRKVPRRVARRASDHVPDRREPPDRMDRDRLWAHCQILCSA